MKRLSHVFAALLLAPFLLSPVRPQVNGNLAGVIAQLLDHPAPPPPPPKELAEAMAAMNGSATNFRYANPIDPGEDAPIKALMAYWEIQARGESGKQPSEKVRQRLLQACEDEPEFPSILLDFLPNTPDAKARLKHILDEGQNAGFEKYALFRQDSRRGLREWLKSNSEYLRDELIRETWGVRDDDGDVIGSRQLAALARHDWRTAEPLLKNYAEGAAPRTAAFALGLIYENATQNNRRSEADTYRDRLKRIAGDLQAPGKARELAIEVLMKTDWQERDEWFLSLFSASTLGELKDGYRTINVLAGPVNRDPDHWIPVIAKLIGASDRNIHNAAALCLAQFVDHRARRDALLPLLPWLSDPQWVVTSDEYARVRLADSVARLKMREALPGLSWIIRNERGYIRSSLAEELEKACDIGIVPTLREAIQAQKKGHDVPSSLIQALIGCGGLTIEEMLAALESCAAKAEVSVDDIRGNRYLHIVPQSKSFDVEVGQIIARQGRASEALADAVVERLKALRKEKPDVAARLWLIAQRWRFPSVDLALVGQMADGSADLGALLTAFERRQDFRDNAGRALRELVVAGGYQSGIGAAVLGDQPSALDILNGDDRAARLALLACARMLREPLPVDKVGALLKSSDKLLALAAERYLESEDSALARKLIRASHPGEALILGARSRFDPKPEHQDEWIRWENRLREDIKTNHADEIYATLESSYTDTAPFRSNRSAIVRARNGKAELCKQQDAAREECRQLDDGELQALRDLYKEVSFEDLPPIKLPGNGLSGSSEEFLKLDRSGGRRVYASELYHLKDYLPYKAKKPHVQLESFFELLCSTGEFELRYALKAKIKELELLSADDQHPVKYVCKQGAEVRALVKEKDSGWNETGSDRKWEEEVWRWRSVVGNRLDKIADQPASCPILDAQEDMPEEMRKRSYTPESDLWKIRSGRNVVRSGKWKDREGLWLCAPGQEPKLVVEGDYSALLVTPDGNHVVAVTRGPFLGTLVRIDLRANRATKVETDHFLHPVTLAPGSGKVYFHRYREDRDEHLLLDPATGKLEVVTGEFEPLGDQNFRPLQPVAGLREYWAAIPDSKNNLTRVGRYDTRAFSFKPLMEIPEIRFTSDDMWVDEASRQIYLAYKGHLLRLPLAIKPNLSGK
ncbi:MAG TPA: hypothetical protein VJ810_29990 [Blastocatellia bacterium]|nr:hypothetical protein [Blastocatellia bacterium]